VVLINWEDNLNQTQLDAVSNTDGALLVIAGAGSGKTRVLTYRVAYLIHEKNVSPESIMAITFTNKAANEMKERIIDLVGKRRYHPWVGTFHRTCANILRNYGASAGLLDSFTIFDDSEQLVVLKRVFKKLDTVPEPFKPRYYLHMISGAKSHLKPPEQLEEEAKTTFEKKVANVYHHYQESLREQNAYDFDDLISETCMLLQNHKPTRDILRNQYKYILVDEFQDINPSQYAFIKLMTNPETRNIFAVGDDDQSIYGWRYADPKFMDNFQEEFAPVTIIKLEENYRSTAPILRVANEVIKKKSWGITKKLHTRKRSGLMPSFYMAGDENKEARYIARQINKHLDDGGNYSDIAILYRMNAQSRSFEEYFSMNGIPFRIIGGLRFYQRMEIKDILSYFRVLANHHDRSSLDRAINTPKRGIGDKSKDRIFNFMSQNRLGLFDLPTNEDILLSMGLQNAIVNRLIPFLELMHEFRDKSKKLKHVDLLSWIIKRTKYEELLEIEDTIEARARIDNLNELRGAFLSFQDNFPDRSLSEFLEHVALVSDIDSYEKTDDSVTMMTLHTAKGLEFDSVFSSEDGGRYYELQDGRILLFFKKRIHPYQGFSPIDSVLPVRIAKESKVKTIILTSSAGGLNPQFHVGDFVVLRDLLILPSVPDSLDASPKPAEGPFNTTLSDNLHNSVKSICGSAKNGIYAYMPGPAYETRAEVEFLLSLGADVVGMSTAYEALYAGESGINVVGLSLVTNVYNSESDGKITHREVLDEASKAKSDFNAIVREFIETGQGV